ncbi:hypothetical protein QQ045_032195 [Rhodiola kirilowii]
MRTIAGNWDVVKAAFIGRNLLSVFSKSRQISKVDYPLVEEMGMPNGANIIRVCCACSWVSSSGFMGLGIAVIEQYGGVLRVQADQARRSSCVSEGRALAGSALKQTLLRSSMRFVWAGALLTGAIPGLMKQLVSWILMRDRVSTLLTEEQYSGGQVGS